MPRLVLEKNRLRFYAENQAGGAAESQQVAWANTGGGTLILQPTTTESWIQASIVGDKVQVGIDNSGLQPGFYSGIVRLVAGQGSDPRIGDPACIRVNTWVASADNDIPSETQSQTINFPTIADRSINMPPFAVSASATSGLPVTIVSSTPAACMIEGNTVTLHAETICTLIASQPGNDAFRAAPDVIRSFTIRPEDVKLTIYLSQIMNIK